MGSWFSSADILGLIKNTVTIVLRKFCFCLGIAWRPVSFHFSVLPGSVLQSRGEGTQSKEERQVEGLAVLVMCIAFLKRKF